MGIRHIVETVTVGIAPVEEPWKQLLWQREKPVTARDDSGAASIRSDVSEMYKHLLMRASTIRNCMQISVMHG